uniref:Transforming acidic coiled-coil-containing protein C-terminal domain-containing protein n=1 Tax=Callorhinchus milii TaxID=7868 RepID=A0A4W3I2R4_CALMI|eukprot:gi/632960320/ref/XP_007896131.1/ PREDICTED: transforming acidic coiled-coil-containing protein 3 [Callorhinchus milii]
MSLHFIENNILDCNGAGDEQCDPFVVMEPTGRQSILRVSQKENLPPKNAMKLSKVSFQTPVRDPVTRKVLGTHMDNNWEEIAALEDTAEIQGKMGNEAEKKGNQDFGVASEALDCFGLEQPQKPDLQSSEANQSTSTSHIGLGNEENVSSSGSYTFDFDLLDTMNPFQGTSKVFNSPSIELNETKSGFQKQSSEPGFLDDTIPVSELSDQVLPKKTEQANASDSNDDHQLDATTNVPAKTDVPETDVEGKNFEDLLENSDPFASKTNVQNSPLPPKASYEFDFDDIDSINPFKTGGSKLQNSPFSAPNPSVHMTEKVEGTSAAPEVQVKLEFEFNDNSGVQKKPPPKKLGVKAGHKSLLKKRVEAQEKSAKKPLETKKPVMLDEKIDQDNIPPPKMDYAVVQDNFDDVNFNPFGGGSKIANSPVVHSETKLLEDLENYRSIMKDNVPELPHCDALQNTGELPVSAPNQPVESTTCEVLPIMEVIAAPVSTSQDSVPSSDVNGLSTRDATDKEEQLFNSDSATTEVQIRQSAKIETEAVHMLNVDFAARDSFATLQSIGEDEEFKPADQIPTFNQPIEIDYLEQFGGSSFHTSALRKQSLYLKFDPLLWDSPVKQLHKFVEMNPSLVDSAIACSSLVHCTGTDLVDAKLTDNDNQSEERYKELDLFTMTNTSTLVPDIPASVDPVAAFISTMGPAEGAIIEVLKYSQKDMDAAIQLVRQEVIDKERDIAEWKKKHEAILEPYADMKKIVAQYSETMSQLIEDSEKKSELATSKLNKVAEEKLQALKELNSVEKSYFELFRRFEKQKEILEGYKKNEESLKKCAQDYLARIQKDEQRYQALKVHAEEKLNLANEEIAQVRNKYKAEVAALQAHLRKEQMKVTSIERSLEEKTKENVELSKICDELISKMEKI